MLYMCYKVLDKRFSDVSPTIVEAVLSAMVKSGSIKRIGVSRAAKYIKA